jgi:phosphate transport system protein
MLRHFELDLGQLQARIVEMGGLVQRAVHLSVEATKRVDGAGAAEITTEVIEHIEPRVDDLHREIDQRAFDLLALQQVVAADLRFVTAATRIGSDLERMSDRAVNISRRAISVLTAPNPRSVDQISKMGESVEAMVQDTMDAFVRRDEGLAREILRRDEDVDRFRDVLFQELVDEVSSETRFIQQALDLILISRNLERIADHATNIAESVVFMIAGEDIRHRYSPPRSTNAPLG